MAIKPLDIFTYYDVQRFRQFSPQDAANWYVSEAPSGKRMKSMYPTMGRQHIRINNRNILIFSIQPRAIFKTINFFYVVVGSSVYQVDQFYNIQILSNSNFTKVNGFLSFDYLPCVQTLSGVVTQLVFAMICDGTNMFVINESTTPATMTTVNQTINAQAPLNPNICVAFGNRFAVSSLNSTQFNLTQINMGGTGFDPTALFTITTGVGAFAQEAGIIREMAVLHNQLYIFCDYTTGIWANLPGIFQNSSFPWKKNTSYDWDYGIADPLSLDVDFGRMVWLAKNRNGLIQFMASDGQMPQSISTQAINVLLQNSMQKTEESDYINSSNTNGFLYQYEDTIFYRVSTGIYDDDQILDFEQTANAIEFNFNTQTWHRCIELNGEKNRIIKHIFFNSLHIVIVEGETTLYEMAGNIYFNELTNPLSQSPQSLTHYLAYPFRYELTTSIISEDDYSEFIDDYIEIDFVWGDMTVVKSLSPFDNTSFLVSEGSSNTAPVYLVTEDGNSYLIEEGSNTPDLNSTIYNTLFNPHVELYISDDGGMSFYSSDLREFSQLGQYQWRMRWYQLGPSRNRVYKLIAVSPSPIVILGGVRSTRRSSGGAN